MDTSDLTPETKQCKTLHLNIWMAGNYEKAKQICNDYCAKNGCCVAIVKCDYIYTGGEEEGFAVELINYPRFPKTYAELYQIAFDLALLLRKNLNQDSFTIQGSNDTKFYSWRHLR